MSPATGWQRGPGGLRRVPRLRRDRPREEGRRTARPRWMRTTSSAGCFANGEAQKIPMVGITDLCFCEYTSHGHCGPMTDDKLDREERRDRRAGSCTQAVNHAKAGAARHRPQRHDGRHGRRPARRAGRRRLRRRLDPLLRGEVRQRLLRPLPRRRRLRAGVRRPPHATRWTPPAASTRRCSRRGSTSSRAPTW